ncbi:Pfam:DUF2343 [Geosmithia morbida]|uniref:Pfam:DUF2343 n=1 Tax=Geosmithia morbida TaxID=1094350 RepID=A0A9P4Z396_9HYPO|nr:Pfam:DUF2343 [Geosmithia morbida]KAF4126652.1 Pfam:DUF2343 [Geosmithia morbida]
MMRLYLLPISTRRTLLYAQRLQQQPGTAAAASSTAGYVDRAVEVAARKWAQWESKESGWQRKVTEYGNHALRRIPYEEWGLKSVPPLSSHRRQIESTGQDKVQLVFPGGVIPSTKAGPLALKLATEREALHRKRLMWCVVAMPFTIPVGILPVVPNLPFFYLVYRSWSHWRAIQGGKHIQWLVQNNLLIDSPSPQLDGLYPEKPPQHDDSPDAPETVLLKQDDVPSFSKTLDMPVLSVELERAIWQVEKTVEGGSGKKAGEEKSGNGTKKDGKQA